MRSISNTRNAAQTRNEEINHLWSHTCPLKTTLTLDRYIVMMDPSAKWQHKCHRDERHTTPIPLRRRSGAH
jgi:hypothetical protein